MNILTLAFLAFLLGVVLVFYIVPVRFRWMALLAASAGFYAFAGWQGACYLVGVAAITYWAARAIARGKHQKALLTACVTVCLGAMIAVKYLPGLPLIAPLGLSYFTFQSVGYVVDVYREKARAERNPCKYLLFVSFFPQLTQGPISTWEQLSPQLMKPKRFQPENFVSGFILLLWGYCKKLVIADRLALVTAYVTDANSAVPGWLIFAGAGLYALRLYADFSGGMDVVRGAAQMLGVDMIENFRRPFFAKTVAEYWRRWHISLGMWFRSYLFYPLTLSGFGLFIGRMGRRLLGKKAGRALPGALSTVLIFIAIGIWHTANWNALFYGLYFGVMLGLALLLEPFLKKFRLKWKAVGVARTLLCITVAQYFAFSDGPRHAFSLMERTITAFSGRVAWADMMPPLEWGILAGSLVVLLIVDIAGECGFDIRGRLSRGTLLIRWPVMLLLILAIVVFGRYGQGFDAGAFIYTQF